MSDTTAEIRGNSPPTRGAGRKPGSRTRSAAEVSEALRKSGGVLGHAARALGITRRALERRLQASPELRAVAVETREQILDVAESALLKAIHAGKLGAITFYLRAFGRHRGWTTGPVQAVVAVPVLVPQTRDAGGITMEQVHAEICRSAAASAGAIRSDIERAPEVSMLRSETPHAVATDPEPSAELRSSMDGAARAGSADTVAPSPPNGFLRPRIHQDRPFIRPPAVRF